MRRARLILWPPIGQSLNRNGSDWQMINPPTSFLSSEADRPKTHLMPGRLLRMMTQTKHRDIAKE